MRKQKDKQMFVFKNRALVRLFQRASVLTHAAALYVVEKRERLFVNLIGGQSAWKRLQDGSTENEIGKV